jgi:AcrR family transcriptional regulator
MAISIQNVLYRNTMARLPKARLKILDAAERVVRDRGAGALTFDEVAAASGVTRGGITYHFPTKEDLLRALVERDRPRGAQAIADQRCKESCPATSDLVAYLRSATGHDAEHKRFVSGMLSAVAHDPGLLDSCRDFYRAQIATARWTDLELRRLMLRLAADGLFWMETFGFVDLPPAARVRLVASLETLAREWSPAGVSGAKPAPAARRVAATKPEPPRKKTSQTKTAATGKGKTK